MALLIDTHAAVWLATDPGRRSRTAREAIEAEASPLLMSAATAWEITELVSRGRLPGAVRLEPILERFAIDVLSLPADAWRVASALPDIHRDPVDRMLLGHGLFSDIPIVTADRDMRRYPVRTIW